MSFRCFVGTCNNWDEVNLATIKDYAANFAKFAVVGKEVSNFLLKQAFKKA